MGRPGMKRKGGAAVWGLAVAAGLVVALVLGWRGHERTLRGDLLRADPDRILGDARLEPYATARGRAVFARHCAACHGAGGAGDQANGMPDLRDGEHLYGTGTVAEVEQIVRYGIRSRHARGWNLASMPAYASLHPSTTDKGIQPLTPAQVEDVTQFLLGLGGRATDAAAVERGKAIYAGPGGCYDCHSGDAAGDVSIGAPSLSDAVWLYGGSVAQIRASIRYGRAGVSPAFLHRLSAEEIRAVAVFTAQLSSGDMSHGQR